MPIILGIFSQPIVYPLQQLAGIVDGFPTEFDLLTGERPMAILRLQALPYRLFKLPLDETNPNTVSRKTNAKPPGVPQNGQWAPAPAVRAGALAVARSARSAQCTRRTVSDSSVAAHRASNSAAEVTELQRAVGDRRLAHCESAFARSAAQNPFATISATSKHGDSFGESSGRGTQSQPLSVK
jgi:hypothetical protein